MEEKIERLRQSIKNNPNLSDAFKINLGSLTDTLVTVYPMYDYSNYENILSSLKINNRDMPSYSMYDKESNTLNINTNKMFEDRIDMQHLFLADMLRMNYENKGYEGFIRGVTEVIASTMNYDDSMKKIDPLESTLVSTFSKIVDPEVLIGSCFNDNITDIVLYLETIGVSKEEFYELANSFNTLDGDQFSNIEVMMINMYGKKIQALLMNGMITYEDISSKFNNFSETLIYNRSELISMYPHHDFKNLTGFEKVSDALDKAIVNSEMIDLEEKVK